jgi:hypothetical protein
MRSLRAFAVLSIVFATAATARADWMTFTGGPVNAIGSWSGGMQLSGSAIVTASNFTNGNNATAFIGLTPISVPNLSPDYFATALQPNPGPAVNSIGTPYNDAGDKYHVVVDFSATTGGSNPGVLPAGSIFAILDLDIQEDYRNVTATNGANVQIVTPWIAGPNGYFDMTNPMIPQGSLIPNPTLTGPVAGVYQMFGVSYNFDVGMWLFQTTQDVKTIAFDMEKSTGGNAIGGGGATWAFYTRLIPEPTSIAMLCWGLATLASVAFCRPRRH